MIERYHWPRTFIVVGAPQVLLALFFHLTVPSPKTAKPTSSVFVDVRTLVGKRPLRALWAGMFVSTIAAAMNKFLPSFCAPSPAKISLPSSGLTVFRAAVWAGSSACARAERGGDVRRHEITISLLLLVGSDIVVVHRGRWLGFGTGIVSGLGGMACGFIVDWVYRKDKDPTVWCDYHTNLCLLPGAPPASRSPALYSTPGLGYPFPVGRISPSRRHLSLGRVAVSGLR